MKSPKLFAFVCSLIVIVVPASFLNAEPPVSVSGIYPHLAMFNNEGECGTGAVVPWAGRLWVVTYAPHMPKGSSDKLYEVSESLEQTVRPESIGGTPANRMIHAESEQLFIGPYAIDKDRNVRVIPYSKMYGRPTGTARHLTDPANKVYFATMEEGLYEVDVKSLEVKELWADEQLKAGRHSNLPGYHGKGLYSGHGKIVYANNGEHGELALKKPDIPSGVLAEWDGKAPEWKVIERRQFTEVTGPAGIKPTTETSKDPIWSIGWDHRSLILMLFEQDQWHRFRLPKSSHSYDGAHGWNTEWPRIREIGEDHLLMTMHGAFWRFPKTFAVGNTAGIAPRSNYLKVIGDFAAWQGKVVFGCDDTAKAEFLNKRKAKGSIAAPQSQSNLWFVEPERIDRLGPVLGRGGVWVQEDVAANLVSDPFLISGYDRRWLHLNHEGAAAVDVELEIDQTGNGKWKLARAVTLPKRGYVAVELTEDAVWMRLRCKEPLTKATAWCYFSNQDSRTTEPSSIFEGLALHDANEALGGIVRARGENERTLSLAAARGMGERFEDVGYYELDGALKLRAVDRKDAWEFTKSKASIVEHVFETDAASILFLDDQGRRWRLPRTLSASRDNRWVPPRVAREVATERDLFHCAGTFYELPAENAGGMAKLRPVASHPYFIHDFCSYRGLFVVSGLEPKVRKNPAHIIRSDDERAGVWVGAIDDLWSMGKPRGEGGPWLKSNAIAGTPSDPYLMMGYDQKSLTLSHDETQPIRITAEIDLTGDGHWVSSQSWSVPPGETLKHNFAPGYGAYWIRFIVDRDCLATAQLKYD